MSKISIDDLPFSSSQLNILHKASFHTIDDFEGIKPSDLMAGFFLFKE